MRVCGVVDFSGNFAVVFSLEMELEVSRPVNPAMTFDEVSMERSKNFVKALQVRSSLSTFVLVNTLDLSAGFCTFEVLDQI